MTEEQREYDRRQAACRRREAYRERKRRGAMVVQIEVEAHDLAALERLALLDAGDRDPDAIADAVAQFLAVARPIAALGDALWPARDGDASPE